MDHDFSSIFFGPGEIGFILELGVKSKVGAKNTLGNILELGVPRHTYCRKNTR